MGEKIIHARHDQSVLDDLVTRLEAHGYSKDTYHSTTILYREDPNKQGHITCYYIDPNKKFLEEQVIHFNFPKDKKLDYLDTAYHTFNYRLSLQDVQKSLGFSALVGGLAFLLFSPTTPEMTVGYTLGGIAVATLFCTCLRWSQRTKRGIKMKISYGSEAIDRINRDLIF